MQTASWVTPTAHQALRLLRVSDVKLAITPQRRRRLCAAIALRGRFRMQLAGRCARIAPWENIPQKTRRRPALIVPRAPKQRTSALLSASPVPRAGSNRCLRKACALLARMDSLSPQLERPRVLRVAVASTLRLTCETWDECLFVDLLCTRLGLTCNWSGSVPRVVRTACPVLMGNFCLFFTRYGLGAGATTCGLCAVCSSDQYINGTCTSAATSTANCVDCVSSCAVGEYLSGEPCDGTGGSDPRLSGDCTPCTAATGCGAGFYGFVRNACDGTGLKDGVACRTCKTCPADTYVATDCSAGSTTDTTVCTSCANTLGSCAEHEYVCLRLSCVCVRARWRVCVCLQVRDKCFVTVCPSSRAARCLVVIVAGFFSSFLCQGFCRKAATEPRRQTCPPAHLAHTRLVARISTSMRATGMGR